MPRDLTAATAKKEEDWDQQASRAFVQQLKQEWLDKYFQKTQLIWDVGCGSGRLAREMREKGYTSIYGVDLSSEMIAAACHADGSGSNIFGFNMKGSMLKARSSSPLLKDIHFKYLPFETIYNAKFLEDFLRYEYHFFSRAADAQFDSILLFSVMVSILDDLLLQVFITNLANHIKPGGIIYLNDFFLQTDTEHSGMYLAGTEHGDPFGMFASSTDGKLFRHHDKNKVLDMFHVPKEQRIIPAATTWPSMTSHKILPEELESHRITADMLNYQFTLREEQQIIKTTRKGTPLIATQMILQRTK